MNKPFISFLAAAFLCVGSGFSQIITSIDDLTSTLTISSSGYYLVTNNLTYSANSIGSLTAIIITASDVTLDLGGYCISCSGSYSADAGCISVNSASNVTVQNGSINGFGFGVDLYNAANSLGNIVQNLRMANVVQGVYSAQGSCLVIRNNEIYNSVGASDGGIGIEIEAVGNVVRGNYVSGFDVGIASSGGNYFLENTICNCSNGLDMASGDQYRFNTTLSCTTPFSGGGTALTDENSPP